MEGLQTEGRKDSGQYRPPAKRYQRSTVEAPGEKSGEDIEVPGRPIFDQEILKAQIAQSRKDVSGHKIRDERAAQEVRKELELKVAPRTRENISSEYYSLVARVRDLLAERKEFGFLSRLSRAGREEYAKLSQEIERVSLQRDNLYRELQKSPAVLTSREKIQVAREKIGAALAEEIPAREDVIRKARSVIGETLSGLPRKFASRRSELHAERLDLKVQRDALGFWQFGKKRELANRMREIDWEMSRLLNQDQKEEE